MSRSYAELDAQIANLGSEGASTLDRIARDWTPDNPLLRHLVEIMPTSEPSLQAAVSGLLKRYAEGGFTVPPDVSQQLLEFLGAATDWTTKLHILQILPRIEIPNDAAESLCDCLLRCVNDRNKFIRAWAYGGLHHLATGHPEYRDEVRTLLQKAARTEPASVRARLRQLPPLD